jgi:hypothetical protein
MKHKEYNLRIEMETAKNVSAVLTPANTAGLGLAVIYFARENIALKGRVDALEAKVSQMDTSASNTFTKLSQDMGLARNSSVAHSKRLEETEDAHQKQKKFNRRTEKLLGSILEALSKSGTEVTLPEKKRDARVFLRSRKDRDESETDTDADADSDEEEESDTRRHRKPPRETNNQRGRSRATTSKPSTGQSEADVLDAAAQLAQRRRN